MRQLLGYEGLFLEILYLNVRMLADSREEQEKITKANKKKGYLKGLVKTKGSRKKIILFRADIWSLRRKASRNSE